MHIPISPAQQRQRRRRPARYSQALPVPLVRLLRLAEAPLLLLAELAPLGKEAKELLADKSALLLLPAASVVVTPILGAGRAAAALAATTGAATTGGATGGTVTAAGFLELASPPAMAPPIAAAPATPTIGPQTAAALPFLTGAHG
mmetsp:Transcript_94657/g.173488  ORF Transcript_94657/g.173488 Transcript_94657/m.173488 type:complete len:146 (-) Transcript_94657:33-470(-)